MRSHRLLLTGALLIGLLPALSGPVAAAPGAWTAEEVIQLKLKPRIARRDGGVTASFFVSASPERAYAILTDHAKLPEFMPNLDVCRVRKQGPAWAEVEMTNTKGTMILRREFEPPRRITWSLVKGTMLKRVDGSWRLDPVAGGTVLTYDSEVETSVPVPSFIIQFVQQDSVSALVSNVRQRIDSDGTWVKPDFKKDSPP